MAKVSFYNYYCKHCCFTWQKNVVLNIPSLPCERFSWRKNKNTVSRKKHYRHVAAASCRRCHHDAALCHILSALSLKKQRAVLLLTFLLLSVKKKKRVSQSSAYNLTRWVHVSSTRCWCHRSHGDTQAELMGVAVRRGCWLQRVGSDHVMDPEIGHQILQARPWGS